MALQIVQLSGGPSNGVEVGYKVPPALPAEINYGGAIYDNARKTKKDSAGDTVHVFDYNAVASGVGIAAPRAHKGWAAMQRSMNRTLPHSLASAERNTRAALRSLGRTSKVRH